MKFLSTLIAAVLLTGAADAHDFWLNPSQFTMDKPGKANLSIRIGHAGDLQNWPSNPDRIVSFRHFFPEAMTDLQSRVIASQKVIPLDITSDGLHLVAIATTHAISELPAEKFNDYVEEEGLTSIHKFREKTGTDDTPGREIYSRRGKALMLVGDLPAADPDFVTQPLGMTLEIVPLVNPYRVEPGGMIDAQINYRGKPLPGAQVNFVSLDTMVGDLATEMSDDKGQVSFKRPAAGDWMIHVVWADPIENNPNGDFDTTFSSLSFGF